MNELITPQGAIRYAVTGRGPAVVFLHSALADHRQWGVQVDALSNDYRCITYDLLGYGSSDNAPDNYDPVQKLRRGVIEERLYMSDAVVELVDKLNSQYSSWVIAPGNNSRSIVEARENLKNAMRRELGHEYKGAE